MLFSPLWWGFASTSSSLVFTSGLLYLLPPSTPIHVNVQLFIAMQEAVCDTLPLWWRVLICFFALIYSNTLQLHSVKIYYTSFYDILADMLTLWGVSIFCVVFVAYCFNFAFPFILRHCLPTSRYSFLQSLHVRIFHKPVLAVSV